MRRLWVLALGVIPAAWLGCQGPAGGWDPQHLAPHAAALEAWPGQRLADARPYPALFRTGVALFLCRWATPATLRVSLPPDADAGERRVLERALAAWEASGLGLRFTPTDGPAELEIRFAAEPEDGRAVRSGDTVADCGWETGSALQEPGERVPAELRFASIVLQRANPDTLGRPVPLSDVELFGAALHEIGHALGFQGHVAGRRSVMTREVDQVRRTARRVWSGDAFRDPSLGALYAVPSGWVVGRRTLDPASAGRALALAERLEAADVRGPFARVGDRSARLWWAEGERPLALVALDWDAVVRGLRPLHWVPSTRAREWLLREAGEGGVAP
ncbi:MAG: matrixin family metalloprotease [Proteobacteria bacterium]|nr:matrixin family metalloprotease [Pseudomonadota bacterium]